MEYIKEKGTQFFPLRDFREGTSLCENTNSAVGFLYEGIIIYDGVVFLYGAYDYNKHSFLLLELTTGNVALRRDEIGRLRSISKIGDILADKIKRDGRTIYEVLRDNKKYLELWEINSIM